jgi:hypothetical protein
VNLGYVRSEKQTVEDQRRSLATVGKTVAKPVDSTRRTWTAVEYRPSTQTTPNGPGRCAHSYGSDAPQQVENHFCKPICKPDAAGQAETEETQKPPEDVAQ